MEGGRVLLGRHVSSSTGESRWTLPGGGVEHGEDPVDTVIREVAEETGCEAVVERLLGVDSRVVPVAERPEPNGQTAESVWTPVADVARLCRSSLVDVGLALAQTRPVTGHVPPVPVGGLIQH
jgi:8-oxo-dGTP diphosphatase